MAVLLIAWLRRLRILPRSTSKAAPAAAKTESARPAPVRRPVAIQSLEGRQMFNGGRDALVVTEQLIGPESAITSVVLTFNEHLNAASANNADAYGIVRIITQTNSDSGGILGTLNPLGSQSNGTTTSTFSKHVRIRSAVYDDASLTVTLTPTAPFRADKYFRFLRVVGTGKNAILTATGQAVDGAGRGKPSDAIIKFASKKGHELVYNDSHGNKVSLHLSGPGELRALFRRVGTLDPIVFVVGAIPGESTLNGVVKKGHRGTGITTLQELAGVNSFTNNLAANTAFNIEMTQP